MHGRITSLEHHLKKVCLRLLLADLLHTVYWTCRSICFATSRHAEASHIAPDGLLRPESIIQNFWF